MGPGLNVFVGENAQGKTNLLEAVATLLLTRSPRTSTAGELLRWGADEAAVDAVLIRGTLSESLALRLHRVREPGRIPPLPSTRRRGSRGRRRATAIRSPHATSWVAGRWSSSGLTTCSW